MRDYAELVKALRNFNANFDSNKLTNDAADAIEELLAFAYAVAKMAVNAEEDEVSAEVLCRKLYKFGIIEKDGVWWWLPEPPKEVE